MHLDASVGKVFEKHAKIAERLSMRLSIFNRTPFGSGNSSAIWNMALSAEALHAARIARYEELERFYRGDQWDWNRGNDDPFVTINYARPMADKITNFLLKKGFKISIPDDPATKEREDDDREFIRAALEQQWDSNYSSNPNLNIELGQTGSVTGDVFLRVSWERNPLLVDPFVKVDVLPSRYVFPDFGGPDGVDGKKVNSILILFPRYTNGEDLTGRIERIRGKERKGVVLYAERWFPDRVEIYDEASESNEPRVLDNPLGEIPIVHIANYPLMSGYYGRSDLADMIDLQREYNEKATDISDTINYQGSPVTVVTGARLGQLETGANRLWGLPEGAGVKNLALNSELTASMAYLKLVKTAMHEVTGVPEGALGAFQDTNTTGVALSLRYLPLIELCDVKAKNYGLGLRHVNRLMLKMLDLMDDGFHKLFADVKDNKYRNMVTFPSPLPRDESIELEKSERRLKLGLSTKKLELEREGKSQAEIQDILLGWLEEKKQIAELEFQLGMQMVDPFKEDQENRSGNPDPERGNKEVRGENQSINATEAKSE